ncbi:MAG: IS5/IS1182 family transposase, partial [Halobacteriota archaeon]
AKTRRRKDGTWAKKGSKSFFGYKLHSKPDMDYGLIRDLETTTAAVHDSQVDLSREGERQYAVIRRVFNASHVMVTTVRRVSVKMIL